MKKILLSITAALLMIVVPANAMDFDDVSEYALFLTDKMAYELNLTEDQYEAAYEINYDYLYDMIRNGEVDNDDDFDDIYGRAWKARNRDFKVILINSQYNLYKQLEYFYRPFNRSNGKIVIKIYNHYPHRDYLYFGCPDFVVKYRGGHGWRHHRRHSYYAGRPWRSTECYGMRDGYRDGARYYRNGTHHHSRHYDYGCSSSYRGHHSRDCYGGFRNTGTRGRVSSTRTTVKNGENTGNRSRGKIDKSRRLPDNRFSPRNNRSENGGNTKVKRSNNSTNNKKGNGRFGGGR